MAYNPPLISCMIKRNMMLNKNNSQRVGKHHQLIDFWLSGKYLTITTSFQALQYCYSVLLISKTKPIIHQ